MIKFLFSVNELMVLIAYFETIQYKIAKPIIDKLNIATKAQEDNKSLLLNNDEIKLTMELLQEMPLKHSYKIFTNMTDTIMEYEKKEEENTNKIKNKKQQPQK